MSGHSKWSTIKRQKASTDAKRGAIFTKLGNLITITARERGGDPETNFSLRIAIDKAKAANMPKENIDRAIKRGTGEISGKKIEELIYEGFGPAKSQFIIKCLTDNKNRTAADIRHIFTRCGGSLGSVMWNFEQHGLIRISSEELNKYNASLRINVSSLAEATADKNETNYEYANSETGEEFELNLIDAGAQDIKLEKEGITIYTKIEDLQKLKKLLEEKNIKTESAEIEYIAKDEVSLNQEDKKRVEKFIGGLEDNEDVSDYYTNVDFA